MRKGKRFMTVFCLVILIALLAVIAGWNRVTDFKTAYRQAYLFLVVMNWFDGIVIDRLWVSRGKIWRIEGMEGVPYVKPWKTVLIKRGAATVLYLFIAAAGAALLYFFLGDSFLPIFFVVPILLLIGNVIMIIKMRG